MKYPRFAQALRDVGTVEDIKRQFGFGRRQIFEYLSGASLPRAEKLLRHPELLEAARRDVREDEPIAA